jgi:predicted permease
VAPILAQTHGADKEFAAGIVFMTSLFCIVTIPVMVMLL